MLKVIEVDGYQVFVSTRDEHPPAHVPVVKSGTKIKIIISVGEVEYHSYKGRSPRNVERIRALEIVAAYLDECLETWSRFDDRTKETR